MPKHESHDRIKNKWVINLSDTKLTESQNQVLQLGQNFALALNRVPVQKVIASVESVNTNVQVQKLLISIVRWFPQLTPIGQSHVC